MKERNFRFIGWAVVVSMLVVVVLTTSFFVTWCGAAGPTTNPSTTPVQAIKLTTVSFAPVTSVRTYQFIPLLDKINQNAKGQLRIEFRGGPEVIGMFEQGNAVKNGVVDIAYVPVAFYQALVRGSDMMLTLSKFTPQQERDSGFNDILVEMHKKVGLMYLGRGSGAENAPGAYVFTNVKAAKPEDFKGKVMSGGVFANPFVQALGVALADMPLSDLYTAMERGTIDGFATFTNQVIGYGIQEKIRYVVDHPFYYTNNAMIMNLNKWNSLPKSMQDLIQQTIVQMEPETTRIYMEAFEKDRAKMFAAGVQKITFSAADAKRFQDLAYEAKWRVEAQKNPEVAAKFEQILKKYGLR